jgi:hypothetical protein
VRAEAERAVRAVIVADMRRAHPQLTLREYMARGGAAGAEAGLAARVVSATQLSVLSAAPLTPRRRMRPAAVGTPGTPQTPVRAGRTLASYGIIPTAAEPGSSATPIDLTDTPPAGDVGALVAGIERLAIGRPSQLQVTPARDSPARVRVAWTPAETAALLQGVQRHGVGQWEPILAAHRDVFHPKRTAVDLKDKYRNVMKQQQRG